MQEVLPGVFHWSGIHPRIRVPVSSYWLDHDGVLIDPLVPAEEGLQWFAERPVPPRAVLLSNRHHFRESHRFHERFAATVHCNCRGLHEFTDGEPVEGFQIGDELPGGVVAHELDAICPDDTALHLQGRRAVVFADGLVRGGPPGGPGPLGFVPDFLMDEPQRTKEALLGALGRLLDELDFEHLLLAHGGPVISDGRELLRELIESGGRTAFEL
jgi:hypothetical protein